MFSSRQVALLPATMLVLAMLTVSCAPRHYHAQPIVPAESAARLEMRSLADPGLERYVDANLGQHISPWPPKSWNLRMLSLAALYFHPAMESARDRVAEAQAAEITAGARPNPTLSLSPGIPSPYLFDLSFDVPIETAGKRGHRIAVARSLDLAARLDLGDTAWRVRSGVRAALLNSLLDALNLDSLRAEEELRRQQVHLLEQRLAVGEIPRPELDQARVELAKVQFAAATAAGQLSSSRATLAAAISIPTSALDGVDLAWAGLDSPPTAESLSPQTIQRDAVLNRLDVRRALAVYAAAEAGLQLEIAKQYPNVQIGPGYTYEEGASFFRLGLAAILPIFNRNQGPIAEAEARRKQAAAAFEATQAQVIAQSETSLARYTAALHELAEADSNLRLIENTRLKQTQRAVELGEQDRLALSGVEIERAVVARTRLAALARAQSALGALEDAVQRPLDPGDAFPPTAAVAPQPGAPAQSPERSQP